MNKIPVGINENKAFENSYLSRATGAMKGSSSGGKMKPGSNSQKSVKSAEEAIEPDANNDDNYQRV